MKKQTFRINLLLTMIGLCSLGAISQNQGNVWCFGHQEKLDFNTTTPTNGTSALNGYYSGAGSANEGVASICDQSGNLLFYTDGQTVYNNTNASMTNGTGLLGNTSSTQSGIIVPKPGSTTQYFVFTVDAWGGSNLIRYNIVDMSTSAGSVLSTAKNLPMPYAIASPTHFAEKITAIPKAGGIGYWLIAHISQETGSNGTFVVWSIGCGSTNDGISETLFSGQRQSVGSTCTYGGSSNDVNTLGYMKVSPDGTKLAYASLGLGIVEVFNFNNSTGVISNPKTINSTSLPSTNVYGIEFSPNSQYLYVADFHAYAIAEYDINATNINASTSVSIINYTPSGSNTNVNWGLYSQGAMQTAKDGNMYITLPGRDHLAKIATPNTFPLTSPMFTENAVTLSSGAYCTLGLPNIVSSFLGNVLISITGTPCSYSVTYAGASNLPSATYQWNFGDGQISTLQNPTHAYAAAGTYIITLIVTDPTTGCSASAQQSIVTTGCGCIASVDPIYYKILNNITITANTVWNDKIYIADNVIVTVDNGATLDITNVDVVFGQSAGIDFKNGAVIRANNSVFRPCDINKVWRGVSFYSTNGTPPSGMVNECTFKNAKTSLEGYSNGTKMMLDLRITNNLFADCQRGVALNNISFKRSMTGNTYMVDNKNLPFNTVSSQLNPGTSPEFYGLYSSANSYFDLISQNDFIFTTNTGINNARICAIYTTSDSLLTITDNKFTDFSIGIYGNYDVNLSVENNSFTWSHLFNMASAPGNKVQVLINYATNVLIKGNKIYNSNVMNSGLTTLPNITTANIGISSNGSKYITVSQNEVNGCEVGMYFNGIYGQTNKYLFVTENTINKSWYYGIYAASYEAIDISCNRVDMELNSNRDATGIAYNNTLMGSGFFSSYTNATSVGIRSNCVLNSKNGIYCYNQNVSVSVPLPKIYNNFVYNYRQYGFENNSFSAVASTSPREIYHNSFVSNNSSSGTFDVNTDAAHVINLEANYGIQNSNSNVTMLLSNTKASTASCAMQVGTFQNNLNDYRGAQLCNYFFTGINTNTWVPVARMIPMNIAPQADSLDYFYDGISFIDPVHTTGITTVNYKDELFTVYPNPAKDKINIRYNIEAADGAYIEFIDVQGKTVKKESLVYEMVDTEINIADLPSGFYILRMTNSAKSIHYSKLVKN